MDDPRLICARLLRETAVERKELQALAFPEIRGEVERRLGDVGLTLATSHYGMTGSDRWRRLRGRSQPNHAELHAKEPVYEQQPAVLGPGCPRRNHRRGHRRARR